MVVLLGGGGEVDAWFNTHSNPPALKPPRLRSRTQQEIRGVYQLLNQQFFISTFSLPSFSSFINFPTTISLPWTMGNIHNPNLTHSLKHIQLGHRRYSSTDANSKYIWWDMTIFLLFIKQKLEQKQSQPTFQILLFSNWWLDRRSFLLLQTTR